MNRFTQSDNESVLACDRPSLLTFSIQTGVDVSVFGSYQSGCGLRASRLASVKNGRAETVVSCCTRNGPFNVI